MKCFTNVTLLGAIVVCLAVPTSTAFASPIVPGFVVTTYASVPDPEHLSFSPDGVLYVGRDNSGSGGGDGDAVKIHRVGIGGSPVVEYGNSSILDPDAVLFGSPGGAFGIAGSVLVGGGSGAGGRITAIRPDQSVETVFGPDLSYTNPQDLAFDNSGRLLFVDQGASRSVFVSAGGAPSVFTTLPEGLFLLSVAVDPANRIYVASSDTTIRMYDSAGNQIVGNGPLGSFATGLGFFDMVFGLGGAFGTDMYGIHEGNLMRVDASGTATQIGSGFTDAQGLALGPLDGALYVADNANDQILRIAPVPEPTTLALAAGGLLTLALCAHRRTIDRCGLYAAFVFSTRYCHNLRA
jgi:hypothetical protein